MTIAGMVVFALATAVKASLVLTLAFFVTYLMRSRPAAERHLVWMLASVCVLAIPLLSLTMPAWRFGVRSDVLPNWAQHLAPSHPPLIRHEGHLPAVGIIVLPAMAPVASGGVRVEAVPVPAPAPEPAPAPQEYAPAVVAPGSPESRLPLRSGTWLLGLLMFTWLGGVGVTGARLLLGLQRVRRLRGNARPLLDPVLLVRAHGIGAQMGLTRAVLYLEGDEHEMPLTFGVLRPTLLLPSSARRWSPARQDAVLRHELAHIRRRDSLSQLLAEVACVIYWFNPMMWWAARSMCVEREHACDDAVLASGSRASDYAAELLEIARTLRAQRNTALAAIAMARPTDLRTRLSALLDPRPRRARTSTTLLVPAWLGAFALVLPISSLVPEISPRFQMMYPARPPVMHTSAVILPEAPQPERFPMAGGVAPAEAPVLAASAAYVTTAATADCASDGRLSRVHNSINNDNQTLKWSGTNCSGEARIEGTLQFDADFTRIASISRGGEVRVTTKQGRTERRVIIRPAAGGLTYDYALNGDRREMDGDAQQWLAETMLFMFRRLGFMAEERATAILQRRGAGALLAETEQVHGDHGKSRYLEVLIERGRLDAPALRRVLDIAGRSVSSDHYRTGIITAVAGRYEMTEPVRDAYIDAASRMSSDHYRQLAFSALFSKGGLTPSQLAAVLRETHRVGSDHYRTILLEELAHHYRDAPGIRDAYLDAAASMSSDHYKSVVITRLLSTNGMQPGDLARVVQAASSIKSDHYRADVLTRVAKQGLNDATLQRAFVQSAGAIASDHYKQTVLSEAVRRDGLDRGALLALLDAAGRIRSDHYRTTLLVDVTGQHRLDGEARARVERLMNEMGSSHYRGVVAQALLKNGR